MVKEFLAAPGTQALLLGIVAVALLLGGLYALGRRPPRPAPPPRPDRDWPIQDAVASIDALTATGRTNWFALLAYLAFVLVTTLGVEDIDFFVDSRQTQLPLIGVSIPTFSFFVFAPVLGAALYAYLHLHIRKVTEALAEAPAGKPPLEERIKPWLLNDFVLRQRPDAAIRRRRMDGLASLTTMMLVWWSGPFVLALMWARTWPAHDLALSLLCAACLLVALYTGALSWVKMRQDLGRRGSRAGTWAAVLVLLLALPLGWLTTATSKGIWEFVMEVPDEEDEIDEASPSPARRVERWARTVEASETATAAERFGLRAWRAATALQTWAQGASDDAGQPAAARFRARTWLYLTSLAALDPPGLTAARLSVLPTEEADLDTARHRYRTAFCDRRGIDAELCDRAPSAAYDPPTHLVAQRQD